MKELNLHGLYHHQVELTVENFILLHEPPIRIITGNSPTMQTIVKKVLQRHGYQHQNENDWNLGSWYIT